jgi:hypothetical protein
MKSALAALLAAFQIVGASASVTQDKPTAAVAPVIEAAALVAGTPISLELLSTITTEGDSWKRGDQFGLVVSESVILGEQVVIPRGTLAFGHVRWTTGRGAFGKSGKLEIEIDHLVLEGRQLRLTGIFRQDGRGAISTATAAMAAGPLAAFITGESGKILRGSVITAYLAENLSIPSAVERPAKVAYAGKTAVVRARSITVAEAFKTEIASADLSKARLRLTVAEVFKPEIASTARRLHH